MAAVQSQAKPSTSPVAASPAFDLGSALTSEILDAVSGGIPDAMEEPPSWEFKPPIEQATPPARKGYVQRWVRVVEADGKTDKANIDEAKRSGWSVRQPDDETRKSGYSDDAGVFSYKGQLVLFEMPIARHKQLMERLNREEDRINQVIYQQTRGQNGLPGKYASLGFDEGRDGESLVD